MSATAKDLETEVRTFAVNLSTVLRGCLPGVQDEPLRVLLDKKERHITLRQHVEEGLALQVGSKPALRLKISYRCTWNSQREFLSVDECQYIVLPESLTEPLFRYHYRRSPTGGLPSAHVHVHGHRDEMLAIMLAGNDEGRVKARLQAIRGGKFPRLASLHFPLGGPRFRPGIEDVIEMLQSEFGIDSNQDSADVLLQGRIVYRQMQLAAAIGDDPLAAAAELSRLGYVISSEPSGEPRLRPPVF